MRQVQLGRLPAATLVVLAVQTVGAQIARTRSPSPEGQPAAGGVPRDPRFPYAGVWSGTRTMPPGTDRIGLRFTVVDGKYAGLMLHPGGGTVPHRKLVATAAGLTWEQPNSGGGTWVYAVRLAGPDSLVGTLVLRDPPPELTPAPRGTMVFTRQAVGGRRER